MAPDKIAEIKALIVNGHLEKALEEVSDHPAYKNAASPLQLQFHTTKEQHEMGKLGEIERLRVYSKLSYQLLELITTPQQ